MKEEEFSRKKYASEMGYRIIKFLIFLLLLSIALNLGLFIKLTDNINRIAILDPQGNLYTTLVKRSDNDYLLNHSIKGASEVILNRSFEESNFTKITKTKFFDRKALDLIESNFEKTEKEYLEKEIRQSATIKNWKVYPSGDKSIAVVTGILSRLGKVPNTDQVFHSVFDFKLILTLVENTNFTYNRLYPFVAIDYKLFSKNIATGLEEKVNWKGAINNE